MYARSLTLPRRSFFLFGPRGTGKSTWIRTQLPEAHVVNLLQSDSMLRYQRDPSLFRGEVLALPRETWVVVDEVQRAPELLNEVHFLMEEKGYKKFALTGSSARKLKRGGANLLAGRATVRRLAPLTAQEVSFAIPVEQGLRYGALPLSVTADDDDEREDFLRSYVTTYLAEEIKAEALARDLGSFSRFLTVAALAAGQRTNVSSIARDAGVARDTVRGYFEVLVDTLLGSWLPPYRPRARIKEVAASKFYWFDPGVLNATVGAFDQPMPDDWNGVLLEHVLLHEIQSYLDYAGVKGNLGYWATPSGSEVDFVFWQGKKLVAIEVKHATTYRAEHRKGLAALTGIMPAATYLVYRGKQELRVDGTWILPVSTFLRRLHAGEVL